MRVTIEYKYIDGQYRAATAHFDGKYYVEVSDTWENARIRLLKKLQFVKQLRTDLIPPAEEVEI